MTSDKVSAAGTERYHIFVHSEGNSVLNALTIDSFLSQSDVAPITIFLVSDESNPILDAPWRSSVIPINPDVLGAFVLTDPNCVVTAVSGGTTVRPGGIETVHAYFGADKTITAVEARLGFPNDFDDRSETVSGPVLSDLEVPVSLDRIRRLITSPRDDSVLFMRSVATRTGRAAQIGEFYFGHGRARDGVSVSIPATAEVPTLPERERDPVPTFTNTKPVWVFGERIGLLAEEGSWQLFDWVRKNRSDIEAYFVVDPMIPLPPTDHLDAVITKGSPDWRIITGTADAAFVTDSARDYLLRNQDRLSTKPTKHIYLTHGGLGYRPGVYQRNHEYFDLVCCDSRHACRAAAAAWDFGASQFAATGLARWDRLVEGFQRRLILFSPTWRKTTDEFGRDNFISTVLDVARSQELNETLNENGYQLALNLHFREEGLQDLLQAEVPENVILVKPDSIGPLGIRAMLEDCAAVITDYSSVFWDIAYRGQKAYLYQFDLRQFLAERERPTFFLPAIQRYFELSNTLPELVQQISKDVETDFVLDEKRREAWDELIARPQDGHCDAICNEVERRFFRPNATPRANAAIEPPYVQVLDDGSRLVGVLGTIPPSLQVTGETTELDPIARTHDALLDECDAVLICPSLDGYSPWADIFFSAEQTTALLEEYGEHCRRTEKLLYVHRSPTYALHQEVNWPLAHNVRYLDTPSQPAQPTAPSRALITVVVPTYNRSRQLLESVHSALAQRGGVELEVIVVDDGSTDDTAEQIARLSRRDDRVRYIHQPNRRQGAARNQGLLAASGRYVTFLDAGDLLHPDFLSEALIAKHADDADVVQGTVVSHKYGTNNFWMGQSAHARYRAPERFTLGTWPALATDPFAVASLLDCDFLKRNYLFFAESFHEDQYFASRLALAGARYASTQKAVYFYCDRQDASGTANFTEAKFQQTLLVGIAIAESYTQNVDDSTARMKLGSLVGRYDRFLSKATQSGTWPLNEPRTASLLRRFLRLVPQGIIKRYAPFCPNTLLWIQHSDGPVEVINEGRAKRLLLETCVTQTGDYIAPSARFAVRSRFNSYRQEQLTFLRYEAEDEPVDGENEDDDNNEPETGSS